MGEDIVKIQITFKCKFIDFILSYKISPAWDKITDAPAIAKNDRWATWCPDNLNTPLLLNIRKSSNNRNAITAKMEIPPILVIVSGSMVFGRTIFSPPIERICWPDCPASEGSVIFCPAKFICGGGADATT